VTGDTYFSNDMTVFKDGNIRGNVLKVLFITQSGAEGISSVCVLVSAHTP